MDCLQWETLLKWMISKVLTSTTATAELDMTQDIEIFKIYSIQNHQLQQTLRSLMVKIWSLFLSRSFINKKKVLWGWLGSKMFQMGPFKTSTLNDIINEMKSYQYVYIYMHTLMLCSFFWLNLFRIILYVQIFRFDPQIVTLKFSAQENSRVLAQIHRKGQSIGLVNFQSLWGWHVATRCRKKVFCLGIGEIIAPIVLWNRVETV